MRIIPTNSDWIEVDSAFGGLAIYKKKCFDIGHYVGTYSNGKEVCEHVSFNLQLKKNVTSKNRFFYFLSYCIQLRVKNFFSHKKMIFDVSHWHVFRVYPFFWFLPATKHIVSVHDAGYYLLPYVQTVANKIFMWNIKKNLNKIHKILVLSENAKVNLVRYGNFPENKIDVVYPGSRFHLNMAQDPFIIRDIRKPKSFIVCVSRWQPHKNVETLIEAFDNYVNFAPNTNVRLVLIGKPVAGHALPLENMNNFNLKDKIIVLNNLTDTEMAWLYDHALFSVSPSIHEGFGLPVLESMSRKCPVLVDINTSTAEVVGKAGLCVDMRSQAELASAISKLISSPDLLNSLKNECLFRAGFFTWEKSLSKLQQVYQ